MTVWDEVGPPEHQDEAFNPLAEYEDTEFDQPGFPALTICGSMRYYQVMLKAAEAASRRGWMVYMPFVACEESEEAVKDMLDAMHLAKIRDSWGILLVGAHRGESTLREIEYAKRYGRGVLVYQAGKDLIAQWRPVPVEERECDVLQWGLKWG